MKGYMHILKKAPVKYCSIAELIILLERVVNISHDKLPKFEVVYFITAMTTGGFAKLTIS